MKSLYRRLLADLPLLALAAGSGAIITLSFGHAQSLDAVIATKTPAPAAHVAAIAGLPAPFRVAAQN